MSQLDSKSAYKLTLKPFSFRRIPTPLDDQQKFRYIGIFNIKEIRAEELAKHNQVNARDARSKSPVSKDILESLVATPELFVLKNSGILVLAESVNFDSKTEMLEITFSDLDKHGVANG